MGLEIKATGLNPFVSQVANLKQLNINYGGPISFGQAVTKQDSFQSCSSSKLFSENSIRDLISRNPNVATILKDNKIKLKLNMKELQELQQGHCKDTQNIAVNIAKNLPQALKQQVNLQNLKEGAMLHDFGKVLIPTEILNKNGALNNEEHKIMDLHSELGYQILKNAGVNDEVLNLVRYHHSNTDSNKSFVPNINLQILNLADKYSALTEERVYKEAFSPEKALTIIYSDVKNGDIHPFLFNALVKSVKEPITQAAQVVNY